MKTRKPSSKLKAASFDPASYWKKKHDLQLSVIAYKKTLESSTAPAASKPVYNLYNYCSFARQLSETIPQFLSRLPPRSTPLAEIGPWIFISNPYHQYRPTSEDLGGFTQLGRQILGCYRAAKAGIEASMAGKAKGTITKKLTPCVQAARDRHIRSGEGKGCQEWEMADVSNSGER